MSELPIPSDTSAIAEIILERSPAIALRLGGVMGEHGTFYVSKNISLYGYTQEAFLSGARTWRDIIHPDDRDDLETLFHGFAEMGNDQFNVVYRIVTADGRPIWISDRSQVIRDADGTVLYTDSIVSDYTETKEHIEKIGESFNQQAVLNEILQGIHDDDIDRALQLILSASGSHLDLCRVVLFENSPDGKKCRAIREWCNEGVSSILEQADFALDYEEDMPEIARMLREDGQAIINAGEIPPGSVDTFAYAGVIASASFAVNVLGKPFGFIVFEECRKERRWSRDIARFLGNVAGLVSPVILRRQNEEIILSLATTDQLTGLSNRHSLEIMLDEAAAKARDLGRSGFLLFLDMDDFKIINDAYGHDYGDTILTEVASYLRYQFGDTNSIFRFGGDEFVIVIEPENSSGIYDVINALLTRAQLPWTILDRTFYCTISIGVVRFPEGREDARDIIKNAEIAMYQAKKMGKNNYVLYTSTLDNDSVARAEIETNMRESIENGFAGFEVYYQPLVSLDKEIIGAEALVRWTMPNGKALSPAQFVPLAEYLGLIISIGEFAMGSAALCCQKINSVIPDFFVSINVSVRQFKQPEFMEKTLRLLDAVGINKQNVVLEITEGMAVHDMQRMKLIAGELRKRGIRISMDDFGTGYSSLSNMRDIPFDVVKIDRSFINGVTTDQYSKSFIRFITNLVHSMNRKVCIEGVETPGQMRYCRECGADYLQGFHLWRPMPENALLELLGLGQWPE